MTHPDFAKAAAHITAEAVRDALVELVDIASPTGHEAGVGGDMGGGLGEVRMGHERSLRHRDRIRRGASFTRDTHTCGACAISRGLAALVIVSLLGAKRKHAWPLRQARSDVTGSLRNETCRGLVRRRVEKRGVS